MSVLEQEKSGETAVVQTMLSAHFETVTSLNGIFLMDKQGAIEVAKTILAKIMTACTSAVSQVVKPDGSIVSNEISPHQKWHAKAQKAYYCTWWRKYGGAKKGVSFTPEKRQPVESSPEILQKPVPSLSFTPEPATAENWEPLVPVVSTILPDNSSSSLIPPPPPLLVARPVRSNRFKSGFLARGTAGSPLPAPTTTFTSSDSDMSPLRDLDPDKSQNRSLLNKVQFPVSVTNDSGRDTSDEKSHAWDGPRSDQMRRRPLRFSREKQLILALFPLPPQSTKVAILLISETSLNEQNNVRVTIERHANRSAIESSPPHLYLHHQGLYLWHLFFVITVFVFIFFYDFSWRSRPGIPRGSAVRSAAPVACSTHAAVASSTVTSSTDGENEDKNEPAPSPDDGPPVSRNASRDPILLPTQIGGNVGAYAGVVLICGFVLVLVGRPLCLRAQTSSKSLDVEMVKPAIVNQYTSPPLSGTSAQNFSWPKSGRSPSIGNSPSIGPASPRNRDTVVTFDQAVIDSDKERSEREREMQRLYAAVMEQNSKSEATVIYDAKAEEEEEQQQQKQQQEQDAIQRLIDDPDPTSNSPISPALPSPRPRISRPLPPRLTNPHRSLTHMSPNSPTSPKRRTVRGLNISSPKTARFEEDEEPLSPTLFESPPGPPSAPSSPPLISLPSSPRPSIPNSPHSTIRSQYARSHTASGRTLPLRSPGANSVHTKETVLDSTGMHGISSDGTVTNPLHRHALRAPAHALQPLDAAHPDDPRDGVAGDAARGGS
ncbi:MAG: kinesin-like protein Klp5 [Trizodia sp. TS-e1964]|nr:MAG: kinesin-like protein Klp5 [Trizodia sp. TS-e1964]